MSFISRIILYLIGFDKWGAEIYGGSPLIRLAFGQPPSPARGEGLSVRLPILLQSGVSARVRAFPLTGEGGTAKP